MEPVLTPNHRANRLLAAVEPEDFAYLEPDLEIVELKRGKVLFETGEVIRCAYFPHEAIVSLVWVPEDGGSVEMATFGRESAVDFVGALISREAFGQYIVQLSGAASRIDLDRLHTIVEERPGIRQLFRRCAEAVVTQTFQIVACNAIHAVEARCCRWLLITHDRVDQDTLPLTHEFLAEMLGVQRSTVSIVLRTLQTAGLIAQQRGGITITDRAGLEETSCECYTRIRTRFERLLPGSYSQASLFKTTA